MAEKKSAASKTAAPASDKKLAIQSAMNQIEKLYGKGSIMRLGDQMEQMNIETISTGSLALDLALGIGGVPRGRIVEIYGPESSGKTTLALHILAQAQKQGGEVAFVDAEHALDPSYARALGVNIDQSPEKCVEELKTAGICFFFAQKYHTSMKYVGAIRRELGIRTVFNILGPITNPASPCYQLLGVYDEYLVEPMARVLTNLGVKRGLVVYGQDRMDEISISAPTTVCDFGGGEYKTYTIQPEDFGLSRAQKSDITGGSAEENAQITRAILSGTERGAKRDIVLMNAGAALYISGKAASIADGIKLAAEMIDSGKAMETLNAYIAVSNA